MPICEMSNKEKQKLIMLVLMSLGKPSTCSDIIDSIWESYSNEERVQVGWRFFVHLNKQIIYLQHRGLIVQVGTRQGHLNRKEKLWIAKQM